MNLNRKFNFRNEMKKFSHTLHFYLCSYIVLQSKFRDRLNFKLYSLFYWKYSYYSTNWSELSVSWNSLVIHNIAFNSKEMPIFMIKNNMEVPKALVNQLVKCGASVLNVVLTNISGEPLGEGLNCLCINGCIQRCTVSYFQER